MRRALTIAVSLAFSSGSVLGFCFSDDLKKLKYSSMLTPVRATTVTDIIGNKPPIISVDDVDSNTLLKTPETLKDQGIHRFGLPSNTNVRYFDDYVLAYDRRLRLAHWVFEHLTAENLKNRTLVDRKQCEFYEDLGEHPYFRASKRDYYGSGFDRGHLAAAGNHWKSQDSCRQTFILSNIAPQVGEGFNRDAWNQLESYVRSLTRHYSNVYVCTGPLFLSQQAPDGTQFVQYRVLGLNTVAVPTHFFKVILLENANSTFELMCYVMPNIRLDKNVNLNQFLVPINFIERASGLLFFSQLPRKYIVRMNKQAYS